MATTVAVASTIPENISVMIERVDNKEVFKIKRSNGSCRRFLDFDSLYIYVSLFRHLAFVHQSCSPLHSFLIKTT